MGSVVKDGVIISRFTEIVDLEVIAQLEEIKKRMYEYKSQTF